MDFKHLFSRFSKIPIKMYYSSRTPSTAGCRGLACFPRGRPRARTAVPPLPRARAHRAAIPLQVVPAPRRRTARKSTRNYPENIKIILWQILEISYKMHSKQRKTSSDRNSLLLLFGILPRHCAGVLSWSTIFVSNRPCTAVRWMTWTALSPCGEPVPGRGATLRG